MTHQAKLGLGFIIFGRTAPLPPPFLLHGSGEQLGMALVF